MDTHVKVSLDSILAKLPETDQELLRGFIQKQQKSLALQQELIKQINQEMDLNRTVLNAAGDGIVAVDKHHVILDYNPAFAEMFGYNRGELKGCNLNTLIPEELHAKHPGYIKAFGEQAESFMAGDQRDRQIHGVHKTRGAFRISIAISHGMRRGEKIFTGIVRDLTQQDELERENLKKTQELNNRTKELEGLYNLAKLREEDNVDVIFNRLFRDIMPKTTRFPELAVIAAEFDGKTYRSRKEDPVVSLTSRLHNGQLTFGFIENIPYGTPRHQQLLDTFVGEFDKTLMQAKAGQRDLQAERISAMVELGTGIAHNVNNGLQVVQAYAQIALDLSSSNEVQDSLKKIQSKTRELGANVRGLLQSTSYEADSHHFENFDLSELLEDYLVATENPLKAEALKNGASVTINRKFCSDASVAGVRGEITLVMQAIIKNSIDAMIEDGSIDLVVERQGDEVKLLVKDTGIGMNPDTQKKIFDPYFTTKGYELGKGLSLATARKIAKEHGGELRLVLSRIGHGTTMEFSLPYVEPPVEELTAVALDDDSITILWAEDDLVIQETVKKMAESLSIHIDFVENGHEAMFALRQREYDILITDIGMPVMGGWKLLKNLVGLYNEMPRVIASGFIINPEDMKRSGADYLLNKPLEKVDLENILNSIRTGQPLENPPD